MSPKRPLAPVRARKLAVLPVIALAFSVGAAPAAAAPKKPTPGKGAAASDSKKPYGKGDGRKFK